MVNLSICAFLRFRFKVTRGDVADSEAIEEAAAELRPFDAGVQIKADRLRDH
jgi:hypothetical protein